MAENTGYVILYHVNRIYIIVTVFPCICLLEKSYMQCFAAAQCMVKLLHVISERQEDRDVKTGITQYWADRKFEDSSL